MKSNKSHYNKKLKPLARGLRKYGTPVEAILWTHVFRAKKFHGLQINRQYPIDNYIADFICRKLKLIIEIDGSSHIGREEYDRKRDRRLNELGYKVVRVSEEMVVNDLYGAIEIIEAALPAGAIENTL